MPGEGGKRAEEVDRLDGVRPCERKGDDMGGETTTE